MKNFVDIEWLNEHLNKKDLVIIDARYSPTNPNYGQEQYLKGHIVNARYVDLTYLIDETSDFGGAKPLPYPKKLAEYFGSIGIHNEKTVVIYDDYLKPESARIWWLLKFIGHTKVFVLNGGYTKWVEKGYPVTVELPKVESTIYLEHPRWDIALKKDEVKRIVETKSARLIDARVTENFSGKENKIELIPTAANYSWQNHIHHQQLKPLDELKKNLESYQRDEAIVHYCGSGIAACLNYLVFDELGFKNIKLYPGSWSDWSKKES